LPKGAAAAVLLSRAIVNEAVLFDSAPGGRQVAVPEAQVLAIRADVAVVVMVVCESIPLERSVAEVRITRDRIALLIAPLHRTLHQRRPSNGSTGSTIVGCSSQSATSRLQKPKNDIMLPSPIWMWQRDSNQQASGKPGAVQSGRFA
jgi:hypothetical protein